MRQRNWWVRGIRCDKWSKRLLLRPWGVAFSWCMYFFIFPSWKVIFCRWVYLQKVDIDWLPIIVGNWFCLYVLVLDGWEWVWSSIFFFIIFRWVDFIMCRNLVFRGLHLWRVNRWTIFCLRGGCHQVRFFSGGGYRFRCFFIWYFWLWKVSWV